MDSTDEVQKTKATARVIVLLLFLTSGIVFYGLYAQRSSSSELVTTQCEPCSVELTTLPNPMIRRIKETGTGFDYLCLSQSHMEQFMEFTADAGSMGRTLLDSYKEMTQDGKDAETPP